MKDDYIKRSAALNCCGEYLPGADLIAEDIRKIPADEDVVKVVRCKDCKFSYEYEPAEFEDGTLTPVHYCSKGAWLDCVVPETFFCKYGERKEADHATD